MQPDEQADFRLAKEQAAKSLRRFFSTPEMLRGKVVDVPNPVTAQVLLSQGTYRYVRRPSTVPVAVGDYVSVLNPGGENSGKIWEIVNVIPGPDQATYGTTLAGVISLNQLDGQVYVIAGPGIQVDIPTPGVNQIRITQTAALTPVNLYAVYNTYNVYQTLYATYNTYQTYNTNYNTYNTYPQYNTIYQTVYPNYITNYNTFNTYQTIYQTYNTLYGTYNSYPNYITLYATYNSYPNYITLYGTYNTYQTYNTLYGTYNSYPNYITLYANYNSYPNYITLYGTYNSYPNYITLYGTYNSYPTYNTLYGTYNSYPNYFTVYNTYNSYPTYNTLYGTYNSYPQYHTNYNTYITLYGDYSINVYQTLYATYQTYNTYQTLYAIYNQYTVYATVYETSYPNYSTVYTSEYPLYNTVYGTAYSTVGMTADGGGQVISTGYKGFAFVPKGGTVTRWTLLADRPGAIMVELYQGSFEQFPSLPRMVVEPGVVPNLVYQTQKNQSTNLTGWSTYINDGDVIGFFTYNVQLVQRIHLTMEFNKSS